MKFPPGRLLDFSGQVSALGVCETPKSQFAPQVSMHPGSTLYIQSPEWASVRRRKLAEVSRCEACSGDERLEVHHLTYDRLGHERMRDLEVLCHWCHMLEHGRAATGFPAAGPSADELTARVRSRESLLYRQERLRDAIPLLREAERARQIARNSPGTPRAKRRFLLLEREWTKLAREVVAA